MKFTAGQTFRSFHLGILLFLPVTIAPAMTAPAFALPPKYGLQQWPAGKQTMVRVYDLKTGRTIWMHSYPEIEETYPDDGKFFWSSNCRAVAFSANGGSARRNKNFHGSPLVVWRARKKVQTVFYCPSFGTDYTEDMTWSPQEKYLIIRGGGSGMGDVDLGNMVCLNLATQRTYPVDESLGRPVWISPYTIKFWRADFSKQRQRGILKASLPSFWTVPYIK